MYRKMYQQFYYFLFFSQKCDIRDLTYTINEIVFFQSPLVIYSIFIQLPCKTIYNFFESERNISTSNSLILNNAVLDK